MCDKCNNHKDCTCNIDTPLCIPVTQHFTEDIFFKSCENNDRLDNLNLEEGTDLSTILKKIDYKLGDNINSVNFSALSLVYLFSKYDIKTIKNFTEAVSLELGYNNTKVITLSNALNAQAATISFNSTKLEAIRIPNIVDSANIGFTVNDTVNSVLQKIVEKFNNLNIVSTVQLNQQDTNTFDVSLTGVGNTTIRGNVKVSNTANNKIQVFSDGLYVASSSVSTTLPTLYINGNVIGINGSNSLTLPTQGLQNLAISGNQLSISGGNSVPLPSLTESPVIANESGTIRFSQSSVNSHVFSADVRISALAGNRVTISSDGIYVAMNATDILNQIAANTTMKELLCSIVASCASTTCYKWYIQNILTTPISVSYIDVNNINQTITVNGSSASSVSGIKILTNPNPNLVITFQGKC